MPGVRAKLTYANVMATIAVFLALGGTSYAALQITGRNVKDGSLTGKDIKNQSLAGGDIQNGSLTLRDFKPGAAPAGEPGPAGAQGPPGPAGNPAAVDAYSAQAPANFVIDDYDMTVISKTLPAGRYVLSATAEVENYGLVSGYMGGISVVECWIPGYRTFSYYLSPNGTYLPEIESLSLTSAIDHPGGAVKLICTRTWNSAIVRNAALTAIKVGSLG